MPAGLETPASPALLPVDGDGAKVWGREPGVIGSPLFGLWAIAPAALAASRPKLTTALVRTFIHISFSCGRSPSQTAARRRWFRALSGRAARAMGCIDDQKRS